MEKGVTDVIAYINKAVNKSEQLNDYSPEMSSKVLDNRIITLAAYIRYIESETIPALKNLVEISEGEENGWSNIL